MDSDELDKRARAVTALSQGAAELSGALEAGDFYQRVAALAKGAADGAARALGDMGTTRVPLDLRPVGEVYGSSWLAELPPTRQCVLTRDGKPFLVQGKVGLLLAPGGTGKTYALAQLAVAVATGGKWLGTYEATKGRVLLALGEEDAEELRRRIYYTAKGLGLSDHERAEIGRNMTVLGLSGRSLAMLGRTDKGEPEASAWFQEWRASLAAAGPWRCILLDPWSRWGGHDVETDNNAATRGVELLEELTQLDGSPTVLVAHHTRKKGKEEKTSGADADAARGASALVDGARWACNLVRLGYLDMAEERPILALRVTKTNYTGPAPELLLTRDETASGVLRPLTPAELAAVKEERRTRKEVADEKREKKEADAAEKKAKKGQGNGAGDVSRFK